MKPWWNYENSHVKNRRLKFRTANFKGGYENLNPLNCFRGFFPESWQFFSNFSLYCQVFSSFFNPRLLNISKINCRLRRAKVIEFSLLLSHFLPRFYPRPYLFFRNLWWSQKSLFIVPERSAGIFIAIVPYTITRSSCQSHKSFFMKGKVRRKMCEGKCLSRMKEYNSYMFPFIWNKLNAMCSP